MECASHHHERPCDPLHILFHCIQQSSFPLILRCDEWSNKRCIIGRWNSKRWSYEQSSPSRWGVEACRKSRRIRYPSPRNLLPKRPVTGFYRIPHHHGYRLYLWFCTRHGRSAVAVGETTIGSRWGSGSDSILVSRWRSHVWMLWIRRETGRGGMLGVGR